MKSIPTGIKPPGLYGFLVELRASMQKWSDRRAFFFAYDVAGGQTITTSWTDILFDTISHMKSGGFGYAAGEIIIKENGWYTIRVDFNAEVSDTTRSHVSWRLVKRVVSSYIEMAGSLGGTSHHTSASDNNTGTITYFDEFPANTRIKLQGLSSRTSEVTTRANSCRVFIRRENYDG